MAVSKLAIAQKEEMVRLYRETPASFSYLSEKYGISVSTVSRFLKEGIPEAEYQDLVTQKQAKRPRRKSNNFDSSLPLQTTLETAIEPPSKLGDQGDQGDQGDRANPEQALESFDIPLDIPLDVLPDVEHDVKSPLAPSETFSQFESVPEVPAEIIAELQDIPLDDEFDDAEDDIEAETDQISDADELLEDISGLVNPLEIMSILPFEQAIFPEICYMVVDKAHEIVTRPLQAFKDLGTIPTEEAQSITVPIFDNHRVVRRFCNPHQLIIKFPSALISATKNKLRQKGITRLLVGGQVYALS